MQLRRPDCIAVRSERRSGPDADAGIFADGSNGSGFANANPLLAFAFAIIVEALVEDHPRVRRVWWQYWVNTALCLTVYNSPEALSVLDHEGLLLGAATV